MKRSYLIILLLSLCTLGYAQNSDFDRIANMEGVTRVAISKAMFRMMPSVKTDKVDLGKMVQKLESMVVLASYDEDVSAKVREKLTFLTPQKGYEEVMSVKDAEQNVVIYVKEMKSGMKEFVTRVDQDESLSLIIITGKLTLEEIQGLTKL